MMVFSVDQFLQVKCKLQLSSESDSAESIHSTNGERIRLCSSVDIDKNTLIIVLLCSNDTGNNHILVYYIEKRQQGNSKLVKPRVIVKQIYYHKYNEDIVALCLGDTGNKLVLISATATIYIIPIKNILLNLHAQQLRSSQGKSMYFYDASITNCCKSIDDPSSVAYWRKSTLVLADKKGKICFINLEEKKEIQSISLTREQIQSIHIIQENLVIVCASSNEYRLSLELLGSNVALEFHKIPIIFHHPTINLVSVIDNLGVRGNTQDAKLLRFYTSKQFFHRPQKPQLICKLPHLMADENIKQLVLTDRFIAIATNRDRCLINSRNCCDLKYLQSPATTTIELNSLVKEITFNHEEKILLLVKSPVSNDLDNIIDSFLLVTNRSIYCIEARYSCREMYINLIDSHLGISIQQDAATLGQLKSLSINPDTIVTNIVLVNTFLCYRDDLYERICYDSRAFSLLFKLDLNSIYEAYGDRSLQRCQFELANRFFQMAKFGHAKILNKYLRLGAYKQTIDYITNILSDENEVLEEKERIDLSRAAFDCLLAKTIVERGKTILYDVKMKPEKFKKLLDYHQAQISQVKNPIVSPVSLHRSSSLTMMRYQSSSASTRDDYGLLSTTLSGSFDLFRLCGHSPRAQDSRLSATTIVGEQHDDEEATLTSNTSDGNSNSGPPEVATTCYQSAAPVGGRRLANSKFNTMSTRCHRLECEKALVDFVKNLMPGSLYNYAMLQLIDFDLIELVEVLASRSHLRIYSLLKILARERDEDRLVFRDGCNKTLVERLVRLKQKDLIKIDTSKKEFLEFLTSPDVTHVLVKDITLTSEFYGYQHTLIQFRKFSFAALRHLETYRKFVIMTLDEKKKKKTERQINNSNCDTVINPIKELSLAETQDDNAFDGNHFFKLQEDGEEHSNKLALSSQQRQTIFNIFVEFLDACLNESTEDSCRLWYNYVNFFLNYVGPLKELERDILELVDSKRDCRMAITLYKGIYRDESELLRKRSAGDGYAQLSNGKAVTQGDESNSILSVSQTNLSSANAVISPLESMSKLYNLAELFENEFLINLLEKTLDLVRHTTDLDALSVIAMC